MYKIKMLLKLQKTCQSEIPRDVTLLKMPIYAKPNLSCIRKSVKSILIRRTYPGVTGSRVVHSSECVSHIGVAVAVTSLTDECPPYAPLRYTPTSIILRLPITSSEILLKTRLNGEVRSPIKKQYRKKLCYYYKVHILHFCIY